MAKLQKVTSKQKVLVAVASKHGSTQEIADKIWRILGKRGIHADFKKIDESTDIAGYEAFIIGSAVYIGSWLEQAKHFIERNAKDLQRSTVWLFSSGPVGSPAKPSTEKAVNIADILVTSKAKEHRLFNGKIDKNRLNYGEKALILAVGAKEGDYRDWKEIGAWANKIADELKEME